MSVKLTPALRFNDVEPNANSALVAAIDGVPATREEERLGEPSSQMPTTARAEAGFGSSALTRGTAAPARRRGRGQMEVGDGNSQAEEGSGRESGSSGAPRYTRRLSDKILIAFHHACDQADFEVAEQLLHILEMMLTRRPLTPDGTRRRNMESLVAAHERLWHLRHPHTGDNFI